LSVTRSSASATRSVSSRAAVARPARRAPPPRPDRSADDDDQRARAEAAAVLEQQAHRQDAAAQGTEAPLGFDQDARRAGLQRLQLRFVVAHALREDRDDSAAGELLVAARESLEVPRGIDAFVLRR